jgi:hypothetical protein
MKQKNKKTIEQPAVEIKDDILPAVTAYAQRLNKIKEKQERFRNLATLAF